MKSIQSFDVREMLTCFVGDPARFYSMARMVRGEIPHHVATLRDSLAAKKLDGLEYSARCIAQLLDSLLANPAAEAARNLETAARLRDQPEAERAFGSLEDELEEFLQDLCGVLNSAA